MADLAGSFSKPFAEQLAALELRMSNLVGTSTWTDLQKAQHERAFVVAGALKADLLDDLAKAVLKAAAEGRGIDAFRDQFKEIVQTHGWHGWTGEGAAKGEAWRTRVIYETNIATSFAAGRMAQLKDGGFSIWVYKHGNAKEPRIQHLAWDGLALPPDHPFWQTHAPPNGWGCTCRIFGAHSAAGVRRRGGDPNKVLPDGWDAIDPKTGAPVGIDKGWNYKVGDSASDVIQIAKRKAEVLPPPIANSLLEEIAQSKTFSDWFSKPIGDFPLVRIADEDAARIGSELKVAVLSPETLAKQMKEHPELLVSEYAMAQGVVANPTMVVQDSPSSLVFVQEGASEPGYVLVVKATKTGLGLFVTSYRRLSKLQAEADREIRRLLRREVK